MTLAEAEANIGRGVVYRRPYTPVEQGVITAVSNTSVFVRYSGDMYAKGTNPEDLEFLAPFEGEQE